MCRGSSTPPGKVCNASLIFIFLQDIYEIQACIWLENDGKKMFNFGYKSTFLKFIAFHKNKSPCYIRSWEILGLISRPNLSYTHCATDIDTQFWWHKQYCNELKLLCCDSRSIGCQGSVLIIKFVSFQ